MHGKIAYLKDTKNTKIINEKRDMHYNMTFLGNECVSK